MASDPDLSGIPVDTSVPVLVTGATGYVAGWIVKGLLDAGVTVHAAVRDPHNTGKVQHLLDLADQSPGALRLFARPSHGRLLHGGDAGLRHRAAHGVPLHHAR